MRRLADWTLAARTTASRLIFSNAVAIGLGAAGFAAIGMGVWRFLAPVDRSRVVSSSAMVAMSQMAESMRQEVAQVVRPQIERTEKLARDPDLIAALKQGDSGRQTEICNRAITQATEIDAFALFDASARIVAINTVYADGKPIAPDRVARIMGLDFKHRDIVRQCSTNGARANVLEFQTTCDITPAFFDSSGLSVAYSVPVLDPATGGTIGVVSSRMRFERLSKLIHAHPVAAQSGSTELVTDRGGYFSEQINTGKAVPPVPVSVLAGIVAPMVAGKVDAVFCKNGPDYLCLVRVNDFRTLDNGGLQVMLVVKEDWLAAEARQAVRLACAVWVGSGLLLILAGTLVRGVRSLGQSAQWSRLLIDSALAAVVTTDDRGNVRDWNPQAIKLFGHTAAEAIGRPLADLVVPAGLATGPLPTAANRPGERSSAGAAHGSGCTHSSVLAARLAVETSVTAVRFGRHTRHCVFMSDVTAYKLTQSHLVQSQKLESIGQLAAGIAHEINTPAQYVGDNVRFLKSGFGPLMSLIDTYAGAIASDAKPQDWTERRAAVDAAVAACDFEFLRTEIPQAIDQSLEGLDRVTAIVGAMKDFSHPGSARKEPADLNRSILSTLEVCRNRWKLVAELSTDLDAGLPLVPCIIAEFNQVMLNLIVNAADAIRDDLEPGQTRLGKIHVSTASRKVLAGEVVEVRVRDDGPGIPESARARIFEPFFTTKPVGKGTGQGLTISRNVIVEKHGGELFFETGIGTGTTFVVRLPVAESGHMHLEAA